MKFQLYYLPFFIFFFSSCKNFLSEKGSCNENPEAGKLLIFIGEKIEVTEMEPDRQVLPYVKIKAKYKVIDVICGNYNKDEITFIAYDHYGLPPFTEQENSILYINIEKDTFYHEMYLYDALYKTKEGEWATPYLFMNFYLTDSSAPKMPLRKIEFAEEVSFDIKGRSRNWVKEQIVG